MLPTDFLLIPLIFGAPTVILLAFRWFRHREHMATLAAPRDPSRALEERMARLEQAVDAIAVEMERLGEGQRFVAKLLAERTAARPDLPGPQPASPPRVITPH